MRYDIIAVIASSRGVPQLRRLLAQLPAGFPVPVVCLAQAGPLLANDLAAASGLDVRFAEPGEAIERGRVYVSPPGSSIVVRDDARIALSPFGPESSALRPVDHLLTSIAYRYGARALCLVVGGYEGDGTEGAHALRSAGGTVLVLDRATAAYFGMAEPIVRAGACERVIGVEEIAEALRASFTSRDILECAELQMELGGLLDSALRASGTRMGNVQLLDRATDSLHIIVYRGFDKRFLDHFSVVRAEDESACGRALRYRQRVVIEDVDADAQYAPDRDVARAAGYRAVQSTPIFRDGGVVAGIFSTHFPYPHHVGAREASLLDGIAREAQPLFSRFA